MPPAYPAPSPEGYRFSALSEHSLSVLVIRTGELVLVSGAVSSAEPSPKHFIFLENSASPLSNIEVTKLGKSSRYSTGISPNE